MWQNQRLRSKPTGLKSINDFVFAVVLFVIIPVGAGLSLTPNMVVSDDGKESNSVDPGTVRNLGSSIPGTLLLSPQQSADVNTCDWNTVMTQFLLDETRDRMEMKFKFENKISELYQELEEVKRSCIGHQEDVSKQNTQKKPIAFSAEVTSHLTGLSRDEKIVFSTILTNVGNAYNPVTGVFTCPGAGIYLFTLTILSNPADRIETEIMLSTYDGATSSVAKLYSGGSTNRFGSGSNSVILTLSDKDRVWVQVYNGLGSFVYKGWSTFAGARLGPD